MKSVSIKLFEFGELDYEAQERAISEHYNFLLDVDGEECKKQDVIENILINNYLFFNDGDLAHTIHFTGKHSKSGRTEFHFHGDVIEL